MARVTHEIRKDENGKDAPLCYGKHRNWRSFMYSLVLAPTCKRCNRILDSKR